EVRLPSTGRTARTDWIGEARFLKLPVSRQRVQVRMLGYAPAELEIPISGDSSAAIFMLDAVAERLEKVDVKAARPDRRFEEFDLHSRMGIARILTDSALAREGTRPISFVLISHFPGLMPKTVEASGRDSVVATSHSGLLNDVLPTCPVAVYIDGIWSPDG